ncbi:DoxX family protein [Gelidibacter japonicus]|uniref:DoxX family protein n=1 Tax=Gelidibacter japonicus TaxID=1962232 RepID=UPI0020207EDA|nr:DoxX family protein [Gelidibacter japonicus]MCL8005901.1 DoxX family protein [Gelidibacter japonicus]
MKTNKIVYYVSTGLLTLLLIFSAGMYFFNYEEVSEMFINFGYPTYLIYPYAVLKLLGLIALWNPNFKVLKEWAYAAFFFAFILAFFAHYMIGDGEHISALVAMVLLIISYIFNKKITKLDD